MFGSCAGKIQIQPRVWTFVAFTYNGVENWGTFHIDNTFGYSDSSSEDHPVSQEQNKFYYQLIELKFYLLWLKWVDPNKYKYILIVLYTGRIFHIRWW